MSLSTYGNMKALQGSQRYCDQEMSEPTGYTIRITRRGPPSRPFGWEIRRQDDSVKLASSTKTFRTRGEALADSARAAAPRVLASKVKSPG
jgi:hypothetical protein